MWLPSEKKSATGFVIFLLFRKKNQVNWLPQTKYICLQSVCKYCGYFESGYYCHVTSNGYNFSSSGNLFQNLQVR